jgi:hypothetical protein
MNTTIGLRRELSACLAMARLAYYARARQGSNWLSATLLVLAVLIPSIAYPLSKKLALSIAWGAGVPLALLAALWWTLLLSSLVNQNQHTARLVPGSGRRAVVVMLCGWALIAGVLTLMFALGGGDPLLGFLLAGMALSITAAAICAPALSWLLYGIAMAPFVVGERVKSLLPHVLTDTVFSLGLFPIALLGLIALRALYKGWPYASGLTKLQNQARLIDAIIPDWLKGTSESSGFARRLRRDCVEGRTGPLLMQGMGHLTSAPSWQFFAVALAAVLVVVWAAPGWVEQYRLVLRALVPALMAALQIVIGATMAQGVYKRQREQALMRLAPRTPGQHLLNATLARSLLLTYGRCWLGSSVLALVVLYCLGVPASLMLRYVAVFLVTLTWANLLLRDYASERSGQGAASVRTAVMLGACFLTLVAPVQYLSGWPWIEAGIGGLVLGGALAWVRWNRMTRAPAAFPAGRMG